LARLDAALEAVVLAGVLDPPQAERLIAAIRATAVSEADLRMDRVVRKWWLQRGNSNRNHHVTAARE
jgi:hypothetical protein